MALSVFYFQTLNPPATVKYRAAIVATDGTTVNPALFTGGTVPVIPATGQPNLFAEARFTNAGDSIGLSPVALNIDATGLVTVLGIGAELTLTARTLRDAVAGLYYSSAALASAYGSRSSQALGAGPVTHVAWLVTTAPAAATDIYAWLSG